MLTTLLIVVPFAAALVVWVLPLSNESTAGLALLAALAEVGPVSYTHLTLPTN